MIAESIIAAAKELGPMKVPVVIRLQGTNSQEGLDLVSEWLIMKGISFLSFIFNTNISPASRSQFGSLYGGRLWRSG